MLCCISCVMLGYTVCWLNLAPIFKVDSDFNFPLLKSWSQQLQRIVLPKTMPVSQKMYKTLPTCYSHGSYLPHSYFHHSWLARISQMTKLKVGGAWMCMLPPGPYCGVPVWTSEEAKAVILCATQKSLLFSSTLLSVLHLHCIPKSDQILH